MDPTVAEALARTFGLEQALLRHREEVLAAALRAAAIRAGLPEVRDPAAEPFPPMRAVLRR